MLTVSFGQGGNLEKNHHTGEKNLRQTLREYAGMTGLYSVFADGDELAHILLYYRGIFTVPTARTCEWTGETARFILLNWKE